jgi:hypothetical protein
MRWYILRPLAAAVRGLIGLLELLIACLGCLRFFLVAGASARYLLQRKRWFEGAMLGRPMRLKDVLEFGAWHARQG